MSPKTAHDKAIAEVIEAVLEPIKFILRGKPAFIQGAVLGEALSLWLIGHPDFMREDLLKEHIKYVRSLIPESEAEVFGASGHPNNGQLTKD